MTDEEVGHSTVGKGFSQEMPAVAICKSRERLVRMLGSSCKVHRLRDNPGEVEMDARGIAPLVGRVEGFHEQLFGFGKVLLTCVELAEQTQRLGPVAAAKASGQELFEERLGPVTVSGMHVILGGANAAGPGDIGLIRGSEHSRPLQQLGRRMQTASATRRSGSLFEHHGGCLVRTVGGRREMKRTFLEPLDRAR